MSTLIHTSAGYGGLASGDTKPTDKFQVKGTDLGYLFTGGKGAWVGGLFGDTFNKPDPHGATPAGGDQWRSPVLGRTSNRDFLTRGAVWDNFAGAPNTGGRAKEIFPYRHVGANVGQVNSGNFDAFTVIPNDAIQVPDGRYFAMGFRVREWLSNPTQAMCWTISNAWFWSDEPNADTWQVGRYRDNLNRLYEWDVWDARGKFFQNASFLMMPNDDNLYVFGSREGRKTGVGTEADGVYLRRAHYNNCFTDTEWEYWGWTGDRWEWGKNITPTPILQPLTPGGFIGELNVQRIAGKIVLTYADTVAGSVALTADRPDGVWSAPTVLVSRVQSAAQYAPSVHPWNTNLEDAYFHLSAWPQISVPGVFQTSLAYCTQGWRGSLVSDSGIVGSLSTKSLSLDTSTMNRDDAARAIQRVIDASAEVNPEIKEAAGE
ncbi:DUF4185 domain-containing protein [Corynebacterium provencense]|uniref:DUF4185 domain-containing protein n=1 Tax=Corynebacterium provencense TaxID=1737425 RepID=UPI00082B5BBB|nr:DUF4185 domain-containing protein [Corynebacterium provencense]